MAQVVASKTTRSFSGRPYIEQKEDSHIRGLIFALVVFAEAAQCTVYRLLGWLVAACCGVPFLVLIASRGEDAGLVRSLFLDSHPTAAGFVHQALPRPVQCKGSLRLEKVTSA